MSQNSPEESNAAFTKDEVERAESQEQAELNASQKAYLQQRVVALRVQNNRLRAEVERLKAELADSDEGSEALSPD